MANARNAKSAREKAAELRADAERAAARKRTVIVGFAVLAVLLIAGGAFVGIKTLSQQQADKKAAAVAPPANLYNGISKVGGGQLTGNASAKVTVDVYSDFMCPICKTFEDTNGPILKKYADEGKIALVHHPVAILDRASQGTQYSTRAANAWAAVVNTTPSATDAFAAALFANQPEEGSSGLPDSTLLDLAEKAGANRAAIEPDVTSLRFGGWVSTRTEQFTKTFAPGGTPTVAINGTWLKDLSPEKLTAAIDEALKK
jgi:protein-disulfide isomerase